MRYCKSTSFQANHNLKDGLILILQVVCDTAKVRVFKQITTKLLRAESGIKLFAILQKYEFSSKSQQERKERRCRPCCLRYCKSTSFQANHNLVLILPLMLLVVCDTAKVRVFKQITTKAAANRTPALLFAILQKYEFSSKSQHKLLSITMRAVVCDTAKVRVFKQITTYHGVYLSELKLFAILQKYEFSSKSQPNGPRTSPGSRCLRYCKSTSFQANHNHYLN